MSSKLVLVSGGLGFIGTHLCRELARSGHTVRVLDNLDPQVHGPNPIVQEGMSLVRGDVRDASAWRNALEDAEVVFHEAAAVGIGQSMYEVRRYVEVNALGTANLLDYLVNEEHEVKRVLLASSMSIYGEGRYKCPACGVVESERCESDLRESAWEPKCPVCQRELRSLPTDEGKPLRPRSIYAITKRDQEEMCMQIGKAYGISTVALRYFNVYGPGQSLSNPYTGVCAIFSSRVKAGKPPLIYEDGKQTRDFVNVKDVVAANILAMKRRSMVQGCFNVGTGTPTSILDVAETILGIYNSDLKPMITGQYRAGDIRHCYADISSIRSQGFKPRFSLEAGMRELSEWARSQEAKDRFESAAQELAKRGLITGRRTGA